MDDKTLMHVKVDYREGIQGKKELLGMELAVLKMLEALKEYHSLRIEELKTKMSINTKIRKVNAQINVLKKVIPDVKVPKKYKEPSVKKIIERKEKPVKKTYSTALERELQEIQEKLRVIDQKF
ncbi:MAG: hypothetical protein KC516_00090 [Nanoarchaeota archaeon]|nr:hypothetical protein [Nanoarchaeota archaeon]